MSTRTAASWHDVRDVHTLADAVDVLGQLAPAPDAPIDEHETYHRRAAEVYRRVADVDLRHHHEALAYAAVETNALVRLREPARPGRLGTHRP